MKNRSPASPAELEAMSATELDTACARTRLENWLGSGPGCFLSILAGLGMTLVPWGVAPPSIGGRIVCGVLSTVGTFLGLHVILGLLGRRSIPFYRELQRRFGYGSFGKRMLELAKDLERSEAMDWIVLIAGNAQPMGISFDITLKIETLGNTHVVEQPSHLGYVLSDGPIVERDIPAERMASLLELLSSLPQNSSPLRNELGNFMMDGCPFEIGVLGKRSAFTLHAGDNLAWIHHAKRGSDPLLILASSVLKLAREAGVPPYGSVSIDRSAF